MRRLNVRYSQIEECIKKSLFAVDQLPRSPDLYPGELLLLQLTSIDAQRLGKVETRVEFALIFDHVERDTDGSISRAHWPNASKVWKYILHCRDTISTMPFSLHRLGLTHDYAGQTQCMFIRPEDEDVIRRHLQPPIDQLGTLKLEHQALLFAIQNQDKVLRLTSERTVAVRSHTRTVAEVWIPAALKKFYDHKCQICLHDFEPRYGLPFADTRYLKNPEKRADRSSDNLIVVCPNHNAIIGVAHPDFDRRHLQFRYANGLVEPLKLRDHLAG